MLDYVLVLIGSGCVFGQIGPVPLCLAERGAFQLLAGAHTAGQLVRTRAGPLPLLGPQVVLAADVRVEAGAQGEHGRRLKGLDVVGARAEALPLQTLGSQTRCHGDALVLFQGAELKEVYINEGEVVMKIRHVFCC